MNEKNLQKEKLHNLRLLYLQLATERDELQAIVYSLSTSYRAGLVMPQLRRRAVKALKQEQFSSLT